MNLVVDRRMQNNLIVKNDIEHRFMHQDAAVVLNKTQFAEAIHEQTDARTGRRDHLGQRLLRDVRYHRLRFAGLSTFRHQQKNSRQATYASVGRNHPAALQTPLDFKLTHYL